MLAGSESPNAKETSNKTSSPPPDHGMELRTRRRIVGRIITATMSTGRFLANLGLVGGEHSTVRRLSRIGVGMGRSEEIPGVSYLKTRIANVKVRIYLPITKSPLVQQPVCIYFHGGGWVLSSARCYHRFTAFFARDTQTIVISVDYRLAPENPFHAGLDDCLAVTRAVLNGDFDHSLFFPHSLDLSKVILAGDSAGGNLACATALDLVRLNDFRLFALLLVCPALQAVTLSFPSYKEHGPYQPIGLEWFVPRYAGVKKVSRRLTEALWRGTHLAPEDRITLSRAVTFGSLYSASAPSMANSSGSGLVELNPEQEVGYGEGQLNEISPQPGRKKFYLEEDEDSGETASGGSCAVSPVIGDFHDEELSPFVVKAVTDLAKNKRAWPLLSSNEELKHLPPTFLQICECDPLRDENDIFSERMKRAGVKIDVSLLEKAGHVESLLVERLPTKVAIQGYQQLVDFIVRCSHANPLLT